MFGGYKKEELPRVIHISVARYRKELPQPGEALEFLVAIHEYYAQYTIAALRLSSCDQFSLG